MFVRSFQTATGDFIFLTEPLVPYNVMIVAVNLAGPGEQETMNFFTREGGKKTAYKLTFLWAISLVHKLIFHQ